jgi:hypothetical protein
MHTPKAILATVFALCMSMAAPMPAQQPLVGSSCILMHFGKRSEPLFDALQALPKTDELLEMRLFFRSTSRADDYDRYVSRYGLSRDSKWALTADVFNSTRILAQGIKPPSVTDIQNALEQAGVKSPIRALRDFLKIHPGHLEARVQLLSHLRSIAEEQTRSALQLGAKPAEGGKPNNGFMVSLGDDEMIFIDPGSNEPDTPDDKKLTPEQDAKFGGRSPKSCRPFSAAATGGSCPCKTASRMPLFRLTAIAQ